MRVRRAAADRPGTVAFLRLNEIERYLNACPDHYQPLASVLIGTGARISEALALRWSDVDLDHGIIRIERQRARNADHTTLPKGKRARSVLIGPRLIDALTHQRSRIDTTDDGARWLFVCPRPTRGRYSRRDTIAPPSRKTVHEWHEHALRTARLPDMPLHALRHTAAAAWLGTGHSLVFVARQLGHRSITTTEHYYGHLELNLFTNALKATDAAIANAGREADSEP